MLPSISFELPEGGAWSPRHDAELATVAARKLASPSLQRALEELQLLRDDAPRLLGYALQVQARRMAANRQLSAFAKPAAAVLGEDERDSDLALIEAMARALHGATDATDAAAQVIQTALDSGHLWDSELLAAAHALSLGKTPLVPPACQIARRSPELDVLTARLCDATLRTARATGAAFAFVRGADLDLPLILAAPDEEFQIFAILAGPRLVLFLLFRGQPPRWTRNVATTEASPLVDASDGTLTVAPISPKEPQAAARAVAALRGYLTRTLDEHLAAHPADRAIFPELEDEHLEKIFG